MIRSRYQNESHAAVSPRRHERHEDWYLTIRCGLRKKDHRALSQDTAPDRVPRVSTALHDLGRSTASHRGEMLSAKISDGIHVSALPPPIAQPIATAQHTGLRMNMDEQDGQDDLCNETGSSPPRPLQIMLTSSILCIL